jgi:probable rRNA maturation factor
VSGAEAERVARAVLRAEGVRRAMVSIALVGRRRIRSLNRCHLGRDRETDVIAFALGAGATDRPPRPAVVGDVYVCVPTAATQARRYDTTPRAELRRLVVHGVLHVLGYRHPAGADRSASPMWRRQERLLLRLARAR